MTAPVDLDLYRPVWRCRSCGEDVYTPVVPRCITPELEQIAASAGISEPLYTCLSCVFAWLRTSRATLKTKAQKE